MKIKFFITSFLILILFISCATNRPNVIVDKKMEALQLAYNFAVQDSIEEKYKPCQTNYYKELSKKNEALKKHKLVNFIQKGDYWGGDFPIISICFDNKINLKKNIDYKELKANYKYHFDKLDTLKSYFKDFYNKINLDNTNKINLEQFINSYKKNKIQEKLKLFFRNNQKFEFKIYFNPINNLMNKAITFINEGNSKRSIVLGYIACKTKETETKINLDFDNTTRRIIIHENCHLYTDELFKKYFDFEFKEKLNQEKFKDYDINVDEIIVRGITAKILEVNYGKTVGEQELENQPKASRIVFETLGEYIKNPNINFETIYIKIIENLKLKYFNI